MNFKDPIVHVSRRPAELITPARATPKELKFLSHIDEMKALRFCLPFCHFYRSSEVALTLGKDPVITIRNALAEALVYYYPLAGRLREVHRDTKKLVVDCTAEGITFIEADADVNIHEFGEVIYPSKTIFSDLLFDENGSGNIFDSPLLLVQVTRFACGGFAMATRFNHILCDGVGIVQFLTAVSEFSRGFSAPSINPIWQRNLICTRDSSQTSLVDPELDQVLVDSTQTPDIKVNMIEKPFIFKNSTISDICIRIGNKCSSFELIAAMIWRARTASLNLDPLKEVHLICIVDSRNKFSPPIPLGYYGNVLAFPAAVTTSGQLQTNPIEYVVELIRNAKARVNEDYIRSISDVPLIIDLPHLGTSTTFFLSDIRRLGAQEIDYGWGKAELGGTPRSVGERGSILSFINPVKGDDFCLVTMTLPDVAMDHFAKELHSMMKILSGVKPVSAL